MRRDVIKIAPISTPLGTMVAGAINKGICLLEFHNRRMLRTQLKRINQRFKMELFIGRHPLFKQLQTEMDEYFTGERQSFDIPLATDGTPFQNKVWAALSDIPHGRTRSYKEQAIAIGDLKAIRAVARANGDNRISIIIPCHRVIGSNGELVGYGGKLWRKKWLLEHEQNQLSLFERPVM